MLYCCSIIASLVQNLVKIMHLPLLSDKCWVLAPTLCRQMYVLVLVYCTVLYGFLMLRCPLLSEIAKALDSGDVTLAEPALRIKASNDKI